MLTIFINKIKCWRMTRVPRELLRDFIHYFPAFELLARFITINRWLGPRTFLPPTPLIIGTLRTRLTVLFPIVGKHFIDKMTDILLCENDCSSSASIEELGSRDVRKVYLVTYSQADIHTFPTRKSFAQAVVPSFSRGSAAILQWCCSQESHKKSGIHYHMCLKLDRNQRCLPSKKYLAGQHNISVHFSSMHANYYTAWNMSQKRTRTPKKVNAILIWGKLKPADDEWA